VSRCRQVNGSLPALQVSLLWTLQRMDPGQRDLLCEFTEIPPARLMVNRQCTHRRNCSGPMIPLHQSTTSARAVKRAVQPRPEPLSSFPRNDNRSMRDLPCWQQLRLELPRSLSTCRFIRTNPGRNLNAPRTVFLRCRGSWGDFVQADRGPASLRNEVLSGSFLRRSGGDQHQR